MSLCCGPFASHPSQLFKPICKTRLDTHNKSGISLIHSSFCSFPSVFSSTISPAVSSMITYRMWHNCCPGYTSSFPLHFLHCRLLFWAHCYHLLLLDKCQRRHFASGKAEETFPFRAQRSLMWPYNLSGTHACLSFGRCFKRNTTVLLR